MVDGDLLLLLTEKELEDDLGMQSGLLRKRFMRELESLKIAADYRCWCGAFWRRTYLFAIAAALMKPIWTNF